MKKPSHPQSDSQLDRLLRALPDKPVASNFTARVLQEVGRASQPLATARRNPFSVLFTAWLPRLVPAGLAVAAFFFAYEARTNARDAAFARSLVAVAQVKSLPSPEVLQDFDAVRAFDVKPGADRELLALLQ